ncbi:MAG TPA: ABC transporter [Bdellovibrionales bacterium]|nr:MAG: ABC transporter [Bdellovibrionales bacterium GWB1_52_6]OFZ04816.1 MAG: ABC transporter [Bdellovibrionales bacterium GWA1_52_35]OFZ36120.1 MAG: ABC transporter [Bdellovibrionales bacterium GWC1_52_8]HAR41939.1 ABC transporter [Bdellovibrionales bacterium]HCM39545.1 ABC transporter [Bdellovibrionales bacterium]
MNKPSGPFLLEARNVSKRYPLGDLEVSALNGITLNVSQGEFMALAGPSGSGKTTLLNLLGCIDQPSSGEIFFDSEPVATKDEKALSILRAKKVGFIFQTFNLIPVLNAVENVEYPLLLLDCSAKERRQRAEQALREVGMEKFFRNRPNQLSGGQRQRLAIARAMVKTPRVILADEPTANLDRKTGGEILELMEHLNINAGVTFILSSHDLAVLDRVKRVFRLQDGEAV